MSLKNLKNKLCLLKLKIPESDVGILGSSLPIEKPDDLSKLNDGTLGFGLCCQLIQYDIKGIWIFFHSETEPKGLQEQELFVPIRYVVSIQLYSEQSYKNATIKPKIGL